uniref:Ig-like domain-containing protein n=1 Tax=Knipowitschia caucasica TaxID=637954 RepID=A0AAV2J7A7_KNICA
MLNNKEDKDHAGTYVCSIHAFPTGSLQRETELRLKGKIECDMNSSIVINLGENVTIQCSHDTEVAYTWTKDEVVVSNSSSLHLQSVSETSAGIYTLTAHTGNRRLKQEFKISISTNTSASWSDAPTLSFGHNSSSQSEANSFSPLTTFATENVLNATTTASPIFHSPTVNLENLEITSASTTNHTHNSVPNDRYKYRK